MVVTEASQRRVVLSGRLDVQSVSEVRFALHEPVGLEKQPARTEKRQLEQGQQPHRRAHQGDRVDTWGSSGHRFALSLTTFSSSKHFSTQFTHWFE